MPEPGFVIIQYGKKQFEKFGCTIYKFSKDFLHRNGARRLPVTRQEVNWHWEQQIMKTYSKSDDPMRVFLLEQVSCPIIEAFWEKRADEEAFKKKRAEQRESGFHAITRDRTAAECKQYQYAAIMTHATHGDVIVPDIINRPLHRISYFELVGKTLEANPTKDLSRRVLQELWEAIVTKIYDYEYGWRKNKSTEYLSTYRQDVQNLIDSKKRKHSEVEEGPGLSGVPQPTKKVKVPFEATPVVGDSISSRAPPSMISATVPTNVIKPIASVQIKENHPPGELADELNPQRSNQHKDSGIIQPPARVVFVGLQPPKQASTDPSQPLAETTAPVAGLEPAPATGSKPRKPPSRTRFLSLLPLP
ncbi:MAG: hypothetical protein ASARMPRED_006903 [Alectoria sarmentosa]|nr:MAG: hypothetical protein ASARMPRED_006903 [Alectoria sarmentosa]